MKEINQLKNITFHYVPSKENPADIGSRGSTFQALQDSLWWTGPPWLSQNDRHWPKQETIPSLTENERTLQQPVYTIYTETFELNPHTRNEENFLLIGKSFANERYQRQLTSSTAHIPRFHNNTLTIVTDKKVIKPTFASIRTLQDSFSHIIFTPENTPYGVKLQNYS